MISFMFKALMVLTFGVISNHVTLWYASPCFFFSFLSLSFGYTTLLFVNDADAEMKEPLSAWTGRKVSKSSTV